MDNDSEQPCGDLMLRTVAMPADTNPSGDIFGGWLLSQMDLAGGLAAKQRAGSRVATVAINAMAFHKPVFVGDVICSYAYVNSVGRTSLTVPVQAWVVRASGDNRRVMVTEGVFTYVAIDEERQPRTVGR